MAELSRRMADDDLVVGQPLTQQTRDLFREAEKLIYRAERVYDLMSRLDSYNVHGEHLSLTWETIRLTLLGVLSGSKTVAEVEKVLEIPPTVRRAGKQHPAPSDVKETETRREPVPERSPMMQFYGLIHALDDDFVTYGFRDSGDARFTRDLFDRPLGRSSMIRVDVYDLPKGPSVDENGNDEQPVLVGHGHFTLRRYFLVLWAVYELRQAHKHDCDDPECGGVTMISTRPYVVSWSPERARRKSMERFMHEAISDQQRRNSERLGG